MHYGVITVVGLAALAASIETAAARVNRGLGMNSDGYRCVPIGRRGGYYRPGY